MNKYWGSLGAGLITILFLVGCSGSSDTDSVAAPLPAPKAIADSADTDNGAEILIDVLINDEGTAIRLVDVAPPMHGEAQVSGTQIRYRAQQGFFGSDRFSYRIADQTGTVATAEVTVLSRVKLRLQGRVQSTRSEPWRISATLGDSALMVDSAADGSFSLEVHSELGEWPLYLEAQGSAVAAPDVQQRFASLLPSLAELLAQSECSSTDCTLAVEQQPRLLLGTLPTAEYGLLAGYATDLELRRPQIRLGLMSYLVGETLVTNAALLDRALNSPGASTTLSITDTLQLAASREDLLQVYQSADRADLEQRRQGLLQQTEWLGSLAQVEQNLDTAGLLWLTAPTDTRLFSAWWWRDGKLINMAEISRDGRYLGTRIPRTAINTDVVAGIDGTGTLTLTPLDPTQYLAWERDQTTAPNVVRITNRIEIRALLTNYALVRRWGSVDDQPQELLDVQVATLPQKLSFTASALPARPFTDFPVGGFRPEFLHDELVLDSAGTFSITDMQRPDHSFFNISGTWLLDEVSGELHMSHATPNGLALVEVRLLAEGAGRSLVLMRRVEAGEPQMLSASAWLSSPFEPAPAILPAPFECTPGSDGYLPVPASPATRPVGTTYRALSDGSALRFAAETLPDPVPDALMYRWSLIDDGRFRFVLARPELGPPTFWFEGLVGLGGQILTRFSAIELPPPGGPLFPYPIDQVWGKAVLYDCHSWND